MMSFFGINVYFFFENDKRYLCHCLGYLGENICSLQPALKSTAPAFKLELETA